MKPILMPQIGQDITKGTIVRWLKKENDPIAKGEVILTVESEKASFDVEADASGVLLKILYAEGDEAEVLAPVGYMGQTGERYDEGQRETAAAARKAELETASAQKAEPDGAPRSPARAAVSPAARRLAGEKGISLIGIRGTGPGGRVIVKDIEDAAALAARTAGATPTHVVAPTAGATPTHVVAPTAGAARAHVVTPTAGAASAHVVAPTAGAAPSPRAETLPAEDRVIRFDSVRKVVAERVSNSSRTVPHFYLFQDVDMEQASGFRNSLNAGPEGHVTVTDIVVWAVARALTDFPNLNAHVESDRMTLKARINVGIAVSTDRGLLVPVIPNADRRDIASISEETKRVVAEARAGRLDREPRSTFTVSSLGMFDIPRFLPIINAPECGLLAVGAVQPRVVPVGGLIGVRSMMTVALACDHRAVDGAYAARFLRRLKEILEGLGRRPNGGSVSAGSPTSESAGPGGHALGSAGTGSAP